MTRLSAAVLYSGLVCGVDLFGRFGEYASQLKVWTAFRSSTLAN